MEKDHTYLVKRVSQIDIATKYIFPHPAGDTEFVYVDNRSGKDIICTPSQTSCKLGCKFCHLTARKDHTIQQLKPSYTHGAICEVAEDMNLPFGKNSTLLISYMGMGEPLLSLDYILDTSDLIVDSFKDKYSLVRFGLATIVPSVEKLNQLAHLVKHPTKVHWSLHQPFDNVRKEIMPSASLIEPSARALANYREVTGNPVEVHYTVFDGNDSDTEAKELARIANEYKFPVKFLRFSERPDKELLASERTLRFTTMVEHLGVKTEIYSPPGKDIKGCCGEFEENAHKFSGKGLINV